MSLSGAIANDSGAEAPEEEAEATRQVLTFRLGPETFGIRVAHVREVLDYKPIARISNAPSTLLGMIDVRGTGVPVVDLKTKLRMPVADQGEPTADSRIVVLDFDEHGRRFAVAVIADAVYEVVDLGEAAIEEPPRFGEAWNSGFMTGLGRRGETFMTLLDIARLFESDVFDLAA